jgi:hypothetical protein
LIRKASLASFGINKDRCGRLAASMRLVTARGVLGSPLRWPNARKPAGVGFVSAERHVVAGTATAKVVSTREIGFVS